MHATPLHRGFAGKDSRFPGKKAYEMPKSIQCGGHVRPEKIGKLRLVIDYRHLNKETIKSCWRIPSNEEIFDTLERSEYFTTINMSWHFHQLPKVEECQHFAAFDTPFGSFRWLRRPIGLTGSPNTFHSLMEQNLVGLTWNTTAPYLDDCIIFCSTAADYIQD